MRSTRLKSSIRNTDRIRVFVRDFIPTEESRLFFSVKGLGEDLVKRSVAYVEWLKLIRSPEFLRDVRTEWLDFEGFLSEMGLPPTTCSVLEKPVEHMRYAAYSVFWVGGGS